jgi:predicted dehydrogenase
MKKIKWGIISTARIGTEKVIPGMLKSRELEVVAIASRDVKTAQSWATKLGIPKAYGSYEDMLADPDIDAVYNPLPNHLHVPLTLAAAKAGKHVLCEKPIGLNAKDAAKLKKVPRGILIQEAFMVRHNPQWIDVRARVRRGDIGTVEAIQCFFSYLLTDPKNVRNNVKMGGGGLLDIGCYPITVARYLFEAEPKRVFGLIDRHAKHKVDNLMSGIADFGRRRHLNFTISMSVAPYQRVQIVGTKGRIEVEIPFNAPPDKSNRVFVQGMDMNVGEWISYPIRDQYMLQAEAFGRAVAREEKHEWPVANAIQNMKIIDAFFKSGKTGKWVKP